MEKGQTNSNNFYLNMKTRGQETQNVGLSDLDIYFWSITILLRLFSFFFCKKKG